MNKSFASRAVVVSCSLFVTGCGTRQTSLQTSPKSSPESIQCGASDPNFGAHGKTWMPNAQRPTYTRALDVCGESLAKDDFTLLVNGTGLPPIDDVSGILKVKNLNIPMPGTCGIKYRNLRSSGTARYLSAQAHCASTLIMSACTNIGTSQVNPAEGIRNDLAHVQSGMKDLRDILDKATPETIPTTQQEVCRRLDAIAYDASSGNATTRLADDAIPIELYDALISRVSSLEEMLGADLRRGSAERAVLMTRIGDLERRTMAEEQLIVMVLGTNPSKNDCLKVTRERVAELEGARQVFDASVRKLQPTLPRAVSPFANRVASAFVTNAFAACESAPNQETEQRLSNIVTVMLEAMEAVKQHENAPKMAERERGFTPAWYEIQIIGYSDQNPLLDRTRCGAHQSNYDLALSRATAIATLITKLFDRKAKVSITAIGEDKQLVRDCNWEMNSDECSAANRRFEIRFWAPTLRMNLPEQCQQTSFR
jgi:flagellar motor protein MotB